jgi:serine/threonine protein kinase
MFLKKKYIIIYFDGYKIKYLYCLFADKVKPAIAHRDLSSRNILVRWDLTCVVCDLSFSMKIMGAHFVRNGQEENAEESSLTDVGYTARSQQSLESKSCYSGLLLHSLLIRLVFVLR